jgi:uncharacterized protein YgiB involved in biofilm formation
MKKSSVVTLTLLAAAALVASRGCNRPTEVRDCVDENRRIVDNSWCDQPSSYYGGHYYWMYGGNSGGRAGDTVFGGSATPTPGVSAITRGGFGGSATGSGGE